MNLLRTTKCVKCGKEPKVKPGFLDIRAERNFYGGKPVKFMDAVCECGEQYIAVMNPVGNNYGLLDLVEKPLPFEPEEQPPSQELQEVEERELGKLKRPELLDLARKLGIEGKIATMKSAELIKVIQEKQATE